jgi:hypothetical protein
MDGYGARQGVCQGVHDDLHARALVLDDGTTSAAIVSCDLLGVDRRLVTRARDAASKTTGIPAEHMLIAGTHTHAGPAGLRRDVADEALLDVTARHIAGAIAAAHAKLRPAALKVGRATVESVSQNRRDPDWPRDTTLRVLLLDGDDPLEPPIACAISFACHATVLYHTNLQFSADYPGHACRAVEQLFPEVGALFLNGACGNVNPAWIEQEHAEAERVGKIVGSTAARLVAELRPLGRGQKAHNIRWDEHVELPVTAGRLIEKQRLRIASRRVELPLRSFQEDAEYASTLTELEARIGKLAASEVGERRRLQAQVQRFETERQVARALRGRDEPLHPEVMAIGFGEGLAMLGLPGEFFVETAEAIRSQAGIADLIVACYANHYIGYVVPPEAYDQGGYEAGITLLAPEAEAIVVREAVALLGEVVE